METISRALIFDSVFDPYKWVLAYVKVVDWSFSAWEEVYLVHSEKSFQPTEVGHFTPEYHADKTLDEGIWKIFDNNIIPELDLTSKIWIINKWIVYYSL